MLWHFLLSLAVDATTASAAHIAQRPAEAVRPYVEAAWIAGPRAGVDPLLLVAVGLVESNLSPVRGDGGRACGPWQYHPTYSPAREALGWDGVCAMLMNDPLEAAMHAAERLAAYPDVCHYQAGHTCRHTRYSRRVEARLARLRRGVV